MQAKSYPTCGDEAVFYNDLNIEFKVIPLNTVAKKEMPPGLEDETDEDFEGETPGGPSKLMVLTNEVKKVGVIIDRG